MMIKKVYKVEGTCGKMPSQSVSLNSYRTSSMLHLYWVQQISDHKKVLHSEDHHSTLMPTSHVSHSVIRFKTIIEDKTISHYRTPVALEEQEHPSTPFPVTTNPGLHSNIRT